MTNFYTSQLIKLLFITLSLNITLIQSVGTLFNKPNNDDVSLYSKFNKRLSTLSDYAKYNMKEASSPYLDKLFKTNNEIITELTNKKKSEHAPKKIHNYYDYNQDLGQFKDVNDYNGENLDDDPDEISNNLNRLIQILGKNKNKKVEDDDYDDDDQEEVIRISGGNPNENNDDGGSDDSDSGDSGGDDSAADDNIVVSNNDEDIEPVIKLEPPAEVNVKLEKPILETTIVKTAKGNPTDDNVSKWVKQNPEKFQTFVHAMYVMKNRDNRKIRHEISCLIYCDRLKAGNLADAVNDKRCVCRSLKKRRQITNDNLIDSSDVLSSSSSLSNHDTVRVTKEVPPLSSLAPEKHENPLKSSENSLNTNENNNNNNKNNNNKNNNNNNENKNNMDGEKFNGNLIESIMKQLREEKSLSQAINDPTQTVQRIPKCDSCAQLLSTQCNATAVLDRVLLELDVLKEERELMNRDCTDGKPCNITGSWNSQVVRMQFNINSSCGGEHELLINVVDHYPPRQSCMMDTNWTLVGYAMHANGGPFYMAATRSKEEVMATFTGMCRTCSGADTIFGTWNFIKPAKDCRDLLMAVDVRRDVFHRSTLHAKVMEKQKQIREKEMAVDETEPYP